MEDDIMNRIDDLEREIAVLPQGNITVKNIKGKDYYYHRIINNKKRTETYIPFDQVEELRTQIDKRKALEAELKELQRHLPHSAKEAPISSGEFNSLVRIGKALRAQIASVRKYKKRECISILRNYIFGELTEKVFILYGLRRTGKTTMVKQILSELSDAEFNKAAFIQAKKGNTLSDINSDLRLLEERGFKYVFIDEVTLIEDFIEGAALFSDIYASSGMKIVLTGTDSLGFVFTQDDQLYDRAITLHTTFIPYREFENVLGIHGIDEYIKYGGTMSISGVNYNKESTFANAKKSNEYINTAIANNIQHSLKYYQDGGHFRQLYDLYQKGELTNVINRVVENINHNFTTEVIEKAFKSSDISITARNLLRDREHPIEIKEHLNLDIVTLGIMQALEILNKEEQTIDIEESHMAQIKEYLTLLDLVAEVDLVSLPNTGNSNKQTIITQPGMRYSQAEEIIKNIVLDNKFNELSAIDRKKIIDRLLSEIIRRMMEDIVLFETKVFNPDKLVFKLQFDVGEFDMVIFDSDKICCEIFEIKHSTELVPKQYQHLKDEEKCRITEHHYGPIKRKSVIYRGDTTEENGIHYINVEKYLNHLV